MNGAGDDVTHLGLLPCIVAVTSSVLTDSMTNSMVTAPPLPHQPCQPQFPGSKFLWGFVTLSWAIVPSVDVIPRHCLQPVRPFMLSPLFLKCLSTYSLVSITAATKQVLGTFHLGSCDSPLARLPACRHGALPAASWIPFLMCHCDCITLGLKSHLLFPTTYRIKFRFFYRIFEAVCLGQPHLLPPLCREFSG